MSKERHTETISLPDLACRLPLSGNLLGSRSGYHPYVRRDQKQTGGLHCVNLSRWPTNTTLKPMTRSTVYQWRHLHSHPDLNGGMCTCSVEWSMT
jgi:hypothetical protein